LNYLDFTSENDSLEVIKIWKEHQELFPIILKESGKVIGVAGLVEANRYKGYREIEIHLSEEFKELSYLAEAHKLILDYGFEKGGLLVALLIAIPKKMS
jgi:RimJ/RimL family protein N-acetyltransferase